MENAMSELLIMREKLERKQYVTFTEAVAAAVAAQRLNGDRYVRKHEADLSDLQNPLRSNNQILLNILRENPADITDEDRATAVKITDYLQSKVMELIAETLIDYWKEAVLKSDLQEINIEDFRTLAFIASIPNSYANAISREQVRDIIESAARESRHFGSVGDAVETVVYVLGDVYSRNYDKWYTTCLDQRNNLVSFPVKDRLDNACMYHITGKIQKFIENNTTKLHYVRAKKCLTTRNT